MRYGFKIGEVGSQHFTERFYIKQLFLAPFWAEFFKNADNIAQYNFIDVTETKLKKVILP